MSAEFEKFGTSERQIAFLEAQLKEIQASREEMHRALLERAYEPIRPKSRVLAPLAVVMSLAAVGLAAFGLTAFLGAKGDFQVEPGEEEGVFDVPEEVADLSPPRSSLPEAPVIAVEAPAVTEQIKEAPKVKPRGKGKGKGKGRGVKPVKPKPPKNDLDFGDCGLDPLCAGNGDVKLR